MDAETHETVSHEPSRFRNLTRLRREQATHPGAPRRRRRLRRLFPAFAAAFVVVFAVLLIVALVATFSLRHSMRASLPQLEGDLHVAGLSAAVTVSRDEHGVPSISAASLEDLLLAQGFVTAQDRLFQMDALRRHGAGELAELLGPSLVDHDKLQRTLRLRATADEAIRSLPPDQLHQLEMYARGVNDFIATHRDTLPIEFHLLHYTPAPWTPRDSLLIGLVMAQDLSTEFPRKLNREALQQHLPTDLAKDLYPVGSWRDRPPQQIATDLTAPGEIELTPLDESQSRNRVPLAAPDDLLNLQSRLQSAACTGCVAGSNNWAIAAGRSASGAPLLSNDMHLTLNAPDIWYEAVLHTPDHALDVEGFTLPGVPFVVVGRNAHVAWGVTVSAADVQDVLIEHVRGAGAQQEYERLDGTWAPVQHHSEQIRVRAGHDITLDVQTTKHGIGATQIETPIISGLNPTEHRTLSLAWYAYDPATLRSPYLSIDTAPDAASLVASFAGFGGPPLSLVYADAQHIGFHSLGRVPVRGPAVQRPRAAAPLILSPAEDDDEDDDDSSDAHLLTPRLQTPHMVHARFALQQPAQLAPLPVSDYIIGSPISPVPVDALDASQAWSGFIPYEALPAVLDPTGGVVATANARTTPDDFHYYFANDWPDPYRVERIHALLDTRTRLTPADMLAVQTDVHSELDQLTAQRLAYAIDHASSMALGHNAAQLHQAADILRRWRGEVTPDSPAAAIVFATRTELWPMLLTAQIKRHDGKSGGGPSPTTLARLYAWNESSSALELLLLHTPARWLPPGVANWDDLLAGTVTAALDHAHAPRDLSRWRYADMHPIEIGHALFGSHSLVSRLLGVATGTGLQPTTGDGSTIKQVGLHFGPSERFTADMADANATLANITTGQSGNPASAFFLDQFDAWLHGTTFTLPLNRSVPTHTLTLLP